VYGTRQFNLLTGRDQHANYRKTNDDKWLDTQTGVIAQEYAHSRVCPLCGATQGETLFVKSGFPHLRCSVCSLMYVTPILNDEEYTKLWSAEDSWESVLENEHQVRMQVAEANYSLDIALQYVAKADDLSVCDVGCGPGTLLAEAKKRGFSVFGVEPNRRSHKVLEQKGIPYTGDFFPLKNPPQQKFDCLFTLNTLEHLHDPVMMVGEMKKLLKNGGILYVSVPNADALVSRIMHEKAGVFGGHSHIQFFDARTLSRLLEKAGFEVLEYETIITELGVIKNYLGYQDPYFGEGQQIDFITPELVCKHHLARNVNVVARAR
jgi:SAM-dependent methyltransferase